MVPVNRRSAVTRALSSLDSKQCRVSGNMCQRTPRVLRRGVDRMFSGSAGGLAGGSHGQIQADAVTTR